VMRVEKRFGRAVCGERRGWKMHVQLTAQQHDSISEFSPGP
jgi:hypothetical protein